MDVHEEAEEVEEEEVVEVDGFKVDDSELGGCFTFSSEVGGWWISNIEDILQRIPQETSRVAAKEEEEEEEEGGGGWVE